MGESGSLCLKNGVTCQAVAFWIGNLLNETLQACCRLGTCMETRIGFPIEAVY